MSENGWRAPRPKEARNYPMNCWWVAAFSHEVGEALTGRWILDTPVLLYRSEAGDVIALENRCPHRSAPLSMGRRRGDNVECIYHGFTYGTDGKCVRIPSMVGKPPEVSVRSFPVIEQGPFVWIFVGDPAVIDDVPPVPSIDWWGESGFSAEYGYLNIAANYMLLKENVLDLTHFGFVHADSFKITDWVEPPKLVGGRDNPGYLQVFKGSPLPPIFAEPLGVEPGTPYDRDNYGFFVSPALQQGAVDLYEPEQHDRETVRDIDSPDRRDNPQGKFRVLHATTPVDPEHMHYFWVIARNYGTSEGEMKAFREITEIGFAEDEAVIEAVQSVMSRDPRPTADIEVSVRADAPSLQARRAIRRWMRAETS